MSTQQKNFGLAQHHTLGYLCVAHNLLFPVICVIYIFGWLLSKLVLIHWIFHFFATLKIFMEILSKIHVLFKCITHNKLYKTQIVILPYPSHALHWIERCHSAGFVYLALSEALLVSWPYMLKHFSARTSLRQLTKELLRQDNIDISLLFKFLLLYLYVWVWFLKTFHVKMHPVFFPRAARSMGSYSD